MADLIKALFNKKKKVATAESEKPVASAKSAKSAEKAAETSSVPAPEVKTKGGLGGLFSSRKNNADFAPDPEPARYVAPEEDANSFFLDADSAKTFGDIDYMRTSKTVRKTFPKVLGAKEGAEMLESISSMEKVEGVAGSMPKASTPEIKPSQETSDRRRQDTSMDMFRNMAKGIKR